MFNFPWWRVALRSNLWLVPALLLLAAIGLAIGLMQLDLVLDETIEAHWSWLADISPEGARSMLNAIAASMVTVAGVVFSITVVVLSLAASQYTSRVLRNFMRDRTTQTVLGVFVGVFGYCLIVLSSVHGDGGTSGVPILSVLGGVVLAFVAIGFLIYFIHHIAASIQVGHILAKATGETLAAIDEMFPVACDPEDEERSESEAERIAGAAATWRAVPAKATGYVETRDLEGLARLASRHGTVLRMECRGGDFILADAPLVSVPADVAVDQTFVDDVNELFTIECQRTIEQDPAFGIRQIVDLAMRSLSPGINDTTSAVMALHRLTAILVRLAGRRCTPTHVQLDGELRLIVREPGFGELLEEALAQIRESGHGNAAVLRAMLRTLEVVAAAAPWPARRVLLARQADAVLEVVRRSVETRQDREALEARAERLLRELRLAPVRRDSLRGVPH